MSRTVIDGHSKPAMSECSSLKFFPSFRHCRAVANSEVMAGHIPSQDVYIVTQQLNYAEVLQLPSAPHTAHRRGMPQALPQCCADGLVQS